VAAGTAALAQDKPPVRVRGEITAVDGDRLTIAARDGSTVQVRLAPEHRVTAVLPADLESVEAGTFVGTAAVPQPDGRLRALELVIFPEEMRGTGEGHYPWDLAPESSMTNATVAATVSEAKGEVLTLTYPDGERTVVVPPEAPIVTLAPGDDGLLRPGNHVFIGRASAQPDGTLSAGSVAVGKDGLVPPM
jgi:hypothetical protein